MKFRKHVFICTNQREEGGRCSCGEERGMELVKLFKKSLKDKGLNKEIRAQRAGCLDTCDYGPSIVVYPEGVFYAHVSTDDVEEIVNSHLIDDKPVERLILKEDK